MDSLPSQTFSVEITDNHIHAGAVAVPGAQTSEWLLNSPDPPTFWEQIVGVINETAIPRSCRKNPNKKVSSSSSEKQSIFKTIITLLQRVFPILKLARNYKASKFKNDLMAGLTLASLCIPQVISIK